jgi:hypothetical protein
VSAPGYNPIRWNCTVSGCFNYHRHFDIEHFAQCFPDRVNFTDLDAFVELNGHVLIVEFKAASDIGGASLTQGQQRAFEQLTRLSDRVTVVVARCNYITSEITEYRTIKGGKAHDWKPSSLQRFTNMVSQWAQRVAPERMRA